MNLQEFAKQLILADQRISEQETELLKQAITEDGIVDHDEIEFLVDLKKKATSVHPSFDEFLFKILKKRILKDGIVSDAEALWLRDLIYRDCQASPREVEFLKTLQQEAKSVGEEFKKLLKGCTQLSKSDFYG